MRTIIDKNHRTIAFLELETYIENQVDAFLVDRRAQRRSEGRRAFIDRSWHCSESTVMHRVSRPQRS